MTQHIDPAIVLLIAVLFLAEGIVLVALLRRYYHNKFYKAQQRFAGYLKFLDDENKKLKKKQSGQS